jgi:GR25 family glycosyltransferase involved in LPS biosynthesis
MLDQSINVYLINLDRSSDKLANAIKNFHDVGLPFHRIAGVDGSTLDMANMEKFAVKKAIEENEWLTPGAIGAAISHYSAYKNLLNSEAEWGLVVEDDVEFSPDVVSVLNSAIRVVNKTDVFLLYFHGDEKSYSQCVNIKVDERHSFYAASTVWGNYSGGAYLIHRDVAQRLHDYVFPVHVTADSWGIFHQFGVIHGLHALLPPISKGANFGSDIGYSRLGTLLRQLEKLKFLPIGYLTRWLRARRKKTVPKYRLVDHRPEWVEERPKRSNSKV